MISSGQRGMWCYSLFVFPPTRGYANTAGTRCPIPISQCLGNPAFPTPQSLFQPSLNLGTAALSNIWVLSVGGCSRHIQEMAFAPGKLGRERDIDWLPHANLLQPSLDLEEMWRGPYLLRDAQLLQLLSLGTCQSIIV